MKKVLLILVVVTTLLSCSKDDKVNGVDISGKYVEIGITNNPPVWEFTKGVITSGGNKKADYKVSGEDIIVNTTGGNRLVYGVSKNDDVLQLNGKGDWILGYDMKQSYKFKRYVDK